MGNVKYIHDSVHVLHKQHKYFQHTLSISLGTIVLRIIRLYDHETSYSLRITRTLTSTPAAAAGPVCYTLCSLIYAFDECAHDFL